ncbi:MAG: acetyl-CoA carboxylase biotin carboxyl carrier protein [Deltaproteobacteria bacterium]|nr:MAG: acetyl-CoA carboxylase biotin carboxyl carrier protein [Deltaproteobacteria bacterium]
MDPKKLEEIVSILEGTDISFLEWRSGEERWTIRRGPESPQIVSAPVVQAAQPVAAAPPPAAAGLASAARDGEAPSDAPRAGVVQVTSPFVGTFYRAPSPESPPFVEVGQTVSPGDTLCIIEAMKLMNEIEAEVSGRIVAILKENGQAVEFGEVLFEIEPTG